jgi:8-hydroxy-5-deazaflavin:NADPH oxidoreductase
MKIGIIGSGIVGQTLALGFVRHGYDTMISSREPLKLNEWKTSSGFSGSSGTFADAAKFGQIIVLATKGAAAEDALKLAGLENLTGKTILDATNPISETQPPQNGVLKFFTNEGDSLMERLQKLAPDANFVKAFSCVGSAFMVNPDFNGIKPTMFICGNNQNAKDEAISILHKFGWEYEDMGKANAAGTIENLCILWCIPGLLRNEWSHAFKMLKK